MWTLALWPGARSVDARASVWVAPELIDQALLGVAAGLAATLHKTSVPVGRGSLTVTPLAVAAPAAPVFVTVIVNPIVDPAETVALSGVFVIEIVGHCTVVVAVTGFGDAPFVSEAVAVLLYRAHEPAVVLLTM
jgi:hypothetical protein